MVKQKDNDVKVIAVLPDSVGSNAEEQNKSTGTTLTVRPNGAVSNKRKMNRDLGAKAPAKRQINLIKKEVKTVDIGKRILATVLAAVLILAAGGYAIMRWSTVSSLRKQVYQMEDELASMKLISATYDEINEEYIRYSTAYETSAEHRTQDSRVLIDKTRELVEPYGYITNITVEGNTLKVTIYSMDISKVTDSLNNDPDGLVTMVIPMTEQKDREAAGEGPQSPSGETPTPAAPAEPGGEQGESPAQTSEEVPDKVLAESMASFQLIFADKEG